MPIVPLTADWTNGYVSPPMNYMCEDVFYFGYTTIFTSPNFLFTEGLVECFRAENVIQSDICGTNWVRDPIIRTSTGLLFAVSIGTHEHRFPVYDGWIPASKFHEIGIRGNPYMRGKKILLALTFYENIMREERVTLGLHQLGIAGGNLITGRRWSLDYSNHPQLITLMGKNACFQLASFLQKDEIDSLLRRRFGVSTMEEISRELKRKWDKKRLLSEHAVHGYAADEGFVIEDNIFSAFQSAKQLIHDFYAINMPGALVKLIDQWSYHIDLSVGYLGAGVVLVHDFGVLRDFLGQLLRDEDFIQRMAIQLHDGPETLPTNKDWVRTALSILFQSTLTYAASERRQIVDNIVKSISQTNMVAVRVPACLLMKIQQGVLKYSRHTVGTTPPTPAIVLANRLTHNLCNGIAVNPLIERNGARVKKVTFRWVCPGPINAENDIFFSALCRFVEECVQKRMQAQHRANGDHDPPTFLIEWKIVPIQNTHPTSHGFHVPEGPPLSPTYIPSGAASLSSAPASAATTPTGYYPEMGSAPSDIRRHEENPLSYSPATTTATTMIAYAGGLRCQTMLFGREVANCFRANRLLDGMPSIWKGAGVPFCADQDVKNEAFAVTPSLERMFWGVRHENSWFVPRFSEVLAPIFEIGRAEEISFNLLGYNANLAQIPFKVSFLTPPDPKIELRIESDAAV